MMSKRFIGVRHRVKMGADNKPRPTQIAIIGNGKVVSYDLASEMDELDWVFGRFPRKYRKIDPEVDTEATLAETLKGIPEHQVKWRKLKKDEVVPEEQAYRLSPDKKQIAVKIPIEFDGLREGDVFASVLGGSGDNLCYAASRRADSIGAKVMRVPPFMLKDHRPGDKDDDAVNLAMLAEDMQQIFYVTEPRDRDLIRVRETLRSRTDAMKARIACGQRIRSRIIGMTFCSEDGLYPEGTIENAFDLAKANDVIYQNLVAEERKRNRDLAKACEALEVYREVFGPIKGVGPAIAARIISCVQDIRRFATAAKLKAYCGVHVNKDGMFVRRRAGVVANWHPDARQALYLVGDQFNRRPDSKWGLRLREYKALFREKRPHVECSTCGCKWEECEHQKSHKRRYTDGHIHKMATWRTITKFVESLFDDWWKLEKRQQARRNGGPPQLEVIEGANSDFTDEGEGEVARQAG